MSPEFWKKVKEAFTAAVDLPTGERQKLLASLDDVLVRQKVEQMIAEDEKSRGKTVRPAINILSLWGTETEDLVGARIDNYEIVREIGRGGMGVAFEVSYSTEDVVQHAALKVLRRGMDSEALLRSFQNERRILASLEHQHIVRLLDAGVTDDGLPYYTMELVDGIPLDEYVAKHDLDLEARLSLFQQICSAVIYAHAKLVVHRDLKPSNVLVTPDGNVKLLDFGIAKDISLDRKGVEGTATQLGIMTPRYASPEQIRGESVTVATDVYNLGIILYELLTGVLPYDFPTENPVDVARIISEFEPKKPSDVHFTDQQTGNRLRTAARNPQLKGDLDTIIIKALQKVPSRRYATVEQFSNDISRYLNGLPITARPDTFRYRAEKFVARNRLAVGAGVFMMLALLIGASVGIWQAIIASGQRAFALRRFEEIRKISNKAVFRYLDVTGNLAGSTDLTEELVSDIDTYLDSLASESLIDTSLKLEIAKAYRKIGDVQGNPDKQSLGRSNDALASYQKSVAVSESVLKLEPNNVEVKKDLFLSLLSEAQMGVLVEKGRKQEILERIQQLDKEIGSKDSSPAEMAIRQADILLLSADLMEPSLEKVATYQKALELLQSVPDRSSDVQMSIAKSIQRLSSSRILLGDQIKADGDNKLAGNEYRLALLHQLQYVEQLKSYQGDAGLQTAERRIAMAYQDLGMAHTRISEFKPAFETLNLSHSKFQNYLIKNPDNIQAQIDVSNSFACLARAYKASNDPRRSADAERKSLEILRRMTDQDTKSDFLGRKIAGLNRLVVVYAERNLAIQSQNIRKQLEQLCSVESNERFCRSSIK